MLNKLHSHPYPDAPLPPTSPEKKIIQQEEPWSVSLRMDPTKKGTIIYFTFQFMFIQGSYNLWKLGENDLPFSRFSKSLEKK